MNFKASASFVPVNSSVIAATYAAALRLAVEQAAEAVLEEAEALVPVASGDLKDSGHVEVLAGRGVTATALVVFDAHHAQFVEYGTGLRGSGTYPYELPTEGVPITGAWVYDYKEQNWQGMAARPYLRPALDFVEPHIYEIFADNLNRASRLLGK